MTDPGFPRGSGNLWKDRGLHLRSEMKVMPFEEGGLPLEGGSLPSRGRVCLERWSAYLADPPK